MNRHARMVLTATLGPAALTLAFGAFSFGTLYLLGIRYTLDQIASGLMFFFLSWQVIALWWLWRNWEE